MNELKHEKLSVTLSWENFDVMLLHLNESVEFTTFTGKDLIVPQHFISDGATIPKMVWSVVAPYEKYLPACIFHDFLCLSAKLQDTNEKKYLTRRYADKCFNSTMKQNKIKTPIRLLLYGAVSLFSFVRWNRYIQRLLPLKVLDYYQHMLNNHPDIKTYIVEKVLPLVSKD